MKTSILLLGLFIVLGNIGHAQAMKTSFSIVSSAYPSSIPNYSSMGYGISIGSGSSARAPSDYLQSYIHHSASRAAALGQSIQQVKQELAEFRSAFDNPSSDRDILRGLIDQYKDPVFRYAVAHKKLIAYTEENHKKLQEKITAIDHHSGWAHLNSEQERFLREQVLESQQLSEHALTLAKENKDFVRNPRFLRAVRFVSLYAVETVSTIHDFLKGFGTGLYQSFKTVTDLGMILYSHPSALQEMARLLVHTISDPNEWLKNMQEVFSNYYRVLLTGTAQEKGEAAGELAGQFLLTFVSMGQQPAVLAVQESVGQVLKQGAKNGFLKVFGTYLVQTAEESVELGLQVAGVKAAVKKEVLSFAQTGQQVTRGVISKDPMLAEVVAKSSKAEMSASTNVSAQSSSEVIASASVQKAAESSAKGVTSAKVGDAAEQCTVVKPDKQKQGTPGNNKAQNKQVDDVVGKLKLTKDQRRTLHDMISGENLGYKEILEIGKQIKNEGLR